MRSKKTSDAGHNIVADRWAGAANPHPHPTPHPTPLPTQTHTQKAKTLVFPLFDSCSGTDGQMDRRTDKAPCRVACPQLKTPRMDQWTNGQTKPLIGKKSIT